MDHGGSAELSADDLKENVCNSSKYSPKYSDPKIVCHSNLSPSLD